MTEKYIQSLRRQLKGFPAQEQEALIEEIRSHIESGEEDPKLGQDIAQRRKRMLNELGSPNEMGSNFKSVYRPNGLIDYLLILIPYSLYPVLQYIFYHRLVAFSQWVDVRLYVILYIPLIALVLWRRSAAVSLFWITILVSQLIWITLGSNGFYGNQIFFWAILLLALLALSGYLIWKHRNDLQIVTFGLMSLTMCILGSILSLLNLTDYSLGPLSRSLVILYSFVNNIAFYGLMAAMALFFLPANRQVRWLGLVLYALVLGLNHEYLNNVFTGWVYSLWLILPLIMVFVGWGLEQIRKPKLEVAAS